ncbi:MAG: tetratricopeptide repeat protein [Pseudomonadota bacterium]
MQGVDQERVQQSAKLFAQGQFEPAGKILRRLLSEQPSEKDQHQILVLLGLCSQGLGRTEEAVGYFERAIQVDEYSAIAHFYLGRTLVEQHQLDRARSALMQALSLDPNNGEARALIGMMSMQTGDLDGAVSELRTALRANPNSVAAQSALARVLVMQDEVEEAEQLATQAVQANPKHAGAQEALAAVFIKQGRTAFAEQCLRNAVELQPNSGELQSGLASVLYHQGKDREALPHFQAALSRGFGGARTAINASVSLARTGDRQQAWQVLEQAFQRWPDDGDLRLALADYRLGAGQPDQAQDLISVLEADRFDVRLLQTRIYQALGQVDQAMDLIDTMIEREAPAESRMARLLKLDLAGINQNLEAAQAAAMPLLERTPPDAEAARAWAGACHRLGRLELALEPVERLLNETEFEASDEGRAEQASLHQMLAEMKHRLGQHDAALAHLGRTARRSIAIADRLNQQNQHDLLALWQHDDFDESHRKAPDDGWPAPVIVAGWPGSGREMLLAALLEAADQMTVLDPAGGPARRQALDIPFRPDSMRQFSEGKWLTARKRYYRGNEPGLIKPVVLDPDWYEMSAIPALGRHFPGLTVIWPEIDPRDLELHYRFTGYRDVPQLRDVLQDEQTLAKKLSQLLPVRVIPIPRTHLFEQPQVVIDHLAEMLGIEAVPAMLARLERVREEQGFLADGQWQHYQPLFMSEQINSE